MRQIGVIMLLVGTAGLISLFGKWIYKSDGKEALFAYMMVVMTIIGVVLC
jgi:hypothetical protein